MKPELSQVLQMDWICVKIKSTILKSASWRLEALSDVNWLGIF